MKARAALEKLRAIGLTYPDTLDILSFLANIPYSTLPQYLDSLEISLPDKLFSQLKDELPIAYITGRKEFYGLEFKVTEDTLIPRPETEILIDAVLRDFSGVRELSVLDLCTGSGTILLTLLNELPGSKGTGLDISGQALDVCRFNAEKLGLSERVRLIQADLFNGFDSEGFDIITANPPYVSEEEYQSGEKSLFYEPRLALVSGSDSLSFYKYLLSELK